MTVKLTPLDREAVVHSKTTQPIMTAREIAALAARHGISVSYARELRRRYRNSHDVPRTSGRPDKLSRLDQSELNALLDLRQVLRTALSLKCLCKRFGICDVTLGRYRREELARRSQRRKGRGARARSSYRKVYDPPDVGAQGADRRVRPSLRVGLSISHCES